MSPTAFAAIALLSLMAAISPGPAVLMAARTGVTEGLRTGLFLAAGIGAGAVVVAAGELDRGVSRFVLGCDPEQGELLYADNDDRKLRMEGRAVYRWATSSVPDMARRAVAAAGMELSDLKAFVPHQANLRITDSLVKSLKLPPSVVVARDVVDSGNTSAASVPLALCRLVEEGQVRRGDPVLLLGFGAGLTAAGQVVRCP